MGSIFKKISPATKGGFFVKDDCKANAKALFDSKNKIVFTKLTKEQIESNRCQAYEYAF
jgi:hypothetical protein